MTVAATDHWGHRRERFDRIDVILCMNIQFPSSRYGCRLGRLQGNLFELTVAVGDARSFGATVGWHGSWVLLK